MSIKAVELYRIPVALTQPYHTSFGDLPVFDAVVAVIHTDKGCGAGESTAVPGYSWESPDDVWQFVLTQAPLLIGMKTEEACRKLESFIPQSPFGVTPLLCALEEALSPPPDCGGIALAGILNVKKDEDLPEGVEKLLSQGFKTVKFKVGFHITEDIRRTQIVQACLAGRALLRLDANQHYTLEEARRFVQAVSPQGIELLEQPFDSHDWETMLRFAPECPLPLMLDESIYGPEDIVRAVDSRCASFIKLKICKAGGLSRLREQGRMVAEGGMKLVIGNGVATDISCRQEIRVAAELAASGIPVAAGEMNGFLKQKNNLTEAAPVMCEGRAMLRSGNILPDADLLKNTASAVRFFHQE